MRCPNSAPSSASSPSGASFFFQGEDGIRDRDVTGVQTCALPILRPASPVYWRVEGSLLDLTTVRPVAFFTWNAQTFTERWVRRGLVFAMAVMRPFLYAANRIFATRVVHTVVRGISRDRLDLLGEEYFKYKLQPQLKSYGVRQLQGLVD